MKMRIKKGRLNSKTTFRKYGEELSCYQQLLNCERITDIMEKTASRVEVRLNATDRNN